jgi:antitoxin HicB
MTPRSVDDYLALPYTVEVYRDDSDGQIGFVARVIELPGCLTQADSFAELGVMIEDAKRAWIETALEDGQPIPAPRPVEDYSGKFVVRLPRSMHRRLAEEAERQGVSLNALVSVALAMYIGGASRSDSALAPERQYIPS